MDSKGFANSHPEKPKMEEKGKLRSFVEFFYNPREKKVLGRTGRSWVEITFFYIVFYSCLAGFFAINMAIFLQMTDPKVPRYYGKGSIIGINPGMGYQPWLREDPESTLIYINVSDPSSYEKYTNQLRKFYSKYKNLNDTRQCNGANESNSEDTDIACAFDLFNKIDNANCGEKDNFGFSSGTPCVVLTLNKLIGWKPVAYPKDSAPDIIKGFYNYSNPDVAIACEGEQFTDSEHIGRLQYIPERGIPHKFFPYRVMKNYHQPFALVKFHSPTNGVLLEIECRAYAYNIMHDRTFRLGMVHFELLIDSSVFEIRPGYTGVQMNIDIALPCTFPFLFFADPSNGCPYTMYPVCQQNVTCTQRSQRCCDFGCFAFALLSGSIPLMAIGRMTARTAMKS
uniref:Sodium/potassium-transporting ATPase subunit beta n=1 Tax=Trichuris muris TaxID=70415 RepID=A0A5S6R4C6_TRIMR